MEQIEELFRQYYRPLCLYALHYLGDIDEAEDTVMECYIKFWERNHGNTVTFVKSYLYQTVHHACIDLLRNRSSNEPTLSLEEWGDRICEPAENPEELEDIMVPNN